MPRRVRRIIGVAPVALSLVLLACGAPSHLPSAASSPRRTAGAVSPTPSPLPASVWVLTPLGLNLRSSPGTSAQVLATLAQGAQLQVSGEVPAGSSGTAWLHVTLTSQGLAGYVVDDPTLVTSEPMSLHVEAASGYSNLFPSSWSLQEGNPAVMTAPPSEPLGPTLQIQTAASTSQLMKVPTGPAQEIRQESPVLVWGKTTYLTVYHLTSGNYEFAVQVQFTSLAMLFVYQQPDRAGSDTTLFKQILGSVIVPGQS